MQLHLTIFYCMSSIILLYSLLLRCFRVLRWYSGNVDEMPRSLRDVSMLPI